MRHKCPECGRLLDLVTHNENGKNNRVYICRRCNLGIDEEDIELKGACPAANIENEAYTDLEIAAAREKYVADMLLELDKMYPNDMEFGERVRWMVWEQLKK